MVGTVFKELRMHNEHVLCVFMPTLLLSVVLLPYLIYFEMYLLLFWLGSGLSKPEASLSYFCYPFRGARRKYNVAMKSVSLLPLVEFTVE